MLLILLGLALPARAADEKAAAAAPVFAPPPGTHTAPLTVTLTTSTAGATIYYTTDGSSPSRKTSPVYKGPLALTATATVKAFAFKKGLKASATVTAAYKLTAPPPPPSEEGGTLFLATLTPQSGATTGGSGSSTLTLTQDQSAAVLRFSFSGLTGPVTSQHIHGPDGTVFFDVDTAKPQADGSRVWRIAAAGTFSKAAVLAALRGGECYLNLHTAAYPSGEIKGFFRPSSGSQTFTPPPAPPALPAGPPTAEDAARFLLQATYGPRPGEIEALQQKGFSRWIDEQLALPAASHLAAYDELVRQG
ncbi:MAG TPA: chitobiase/beta-hexosaminidase C-terminal domain-containing protein, partial [Thermoanaerobaculia bacterium]